MKKYALPTHFLLVICISFFLCGCGVRRDVARVSVVESTVERVEETIDTSRIYIETQIETHVQEETQDNTFIRITEFDETGTVVVRVLEEFRDVRSSLVSVLYGQGTHLSINNVITSTVESEETQVFKTEEISFESNSRLIGRMWIASIVLLLCAAGLFIYIRRRWRRKAMEKLTK